MKLLTQHVVWSVLALGLLAAQAGRAEADVLYAADGQNGNPATNLYILDSGTGAVLQTVGPIGFAVTGMAFSPDTGVLYGVTAPKGSNTRELITINPGTGAGTVVGALGVTMDDISFDRNGTLYGWSGRTSGSSLYTINLATGAATLVGPSGLLDVGVGFAINGSGTPYLADAGASGALRTVDLTTGAVTTVATLSGAPFDNGAISAFAFDSDGTLFGINLNETVGKPNPPPADTFLVTVDPATGVITTLGPSVPGLEAITFGPGVTVPEPAALTQAVLGLLTALGCGWWRMRAPRGGAPGKSPACPGGAPAAIGETPPVP
jgi:hypothetical protein